MIRGVPGPVVLRFRLRYFTVWLTQFTPNMRSSLVIAVLLIQLAACASVQGSYVWADDYAAPAQSTRYVLGVGDALSVQVWNNDKISTKARVRSDGRISVPLLNDVDVAGKTPDEAARDIEQKLRVSNLVTLPRVTVVVEEIKPVSVSVLGKVNRAGTYPLDAGSGVAEALASAGGLTPFAHQDRIFVLRRTPTPLRIRFTFASLTDQSQRAALFRLRTGDVIVAE